MLARRPCSGSAGWALHNTCTVRVAVWLHHAYTQSVQDPCKCSCAPRHHGAGGCRVQPELQHLRSDESLLDDLFSALVAWENRPRSLYYVERLDVVAGLGLVVLWVALIAAVESLP